MTRTLFPHRSAAVAALAAAALALGACGSDDTSDDATGAAAGGAAAAASGDADAARVRLQECLREQGVEIPDPGGQGGPPPADLDADAIQEALDGPCAEFRDDAFGDVDEADREEFQDRFQEFAQCMRDEGIDVPDITLGGGVPSGGPARLDRNDPDVQEAIDACEDVAPQVGPGGPGPVGGGAG